MIQHFIITVLVIYGIHGSTRPGMILGFISEFTDRRPKTWYISKALFDCTPCMASVYGTISFFIVEFPTQGLVGLPVWVFSLCGFNYILNKLINR